MHITPHEWCEPTLLLHMEVVNTHQYFTLTMGTNHSTPHGQWGCTLVFHMEGVKIHLYLQRWCEYALVLRMSGVNVSQYSTRTV